MTTTYRYPPARRRGGKHLPARPCRVKGCGALLLFGAVGACDAHPRGQSARLDHDSTGLVLVPFRDGAR